MTIKKFLVGAIFLFGGFYLIKKILPSKDLESFDIDELSVDEAIELARQQDLEKAKKVKGELIKRGILNPDGTENKNFMRMHYLNPDKMFTNLSEEQKQEIREASGVKEIDLSNVPKDLNWGFLNYQLPSSTLG